ncbi:hypothetical protein [Pedobacter miscanthi]|uniref:Uncharacterized protein n=1 Tax=Pedobacter miscanthi TaxID=2259170 RepID=A0A366KV66_9SPHI|nr:hypothetical protein [Pedobacter miscanthi]RBQ05526.1 hypothetical protein DRW42_16215 [Pedobacter miscanthi]
MASTSKLTEFTSLDRTKEVMKWIEFGFSVTKTILYPFKKAEAFAIAQAPTGLPTDKLGLDDDALDIDKISAGFDITPIEMFPQNMLTSFLSSIVSYIGYGFTINKHLNTLLSDEENDLDIMCIHIKRRHLNIAKKVATGAIILFGMTYLISQTVSKAVKAVKDLLQNAIKTLMSIVFACYAIYLIYSLIRMKINGKKWTVNDSEKLLSALGMFMDILEIPYVEKAMARTVKPYWIAVGVSSVINVGKTVLIPFTKPEAVNFDGKFFDEQAVKSKGNRLFVYFCGSGESTKSQRKKFMKDVDAKHQIYINGVGSQRSIYRHLYDSDIKVTEEQIGNNTVKYRFKNDKRDITCIEKFYTGGDRGYKNDDAEKASKYVFDAIKNAIEDNTINELILSGHGRGAAVGLMYLLFSLNGDTAMLNRLAKIKISVVPLDPVAGQTGNDYGKMDTNWYSGKIYDELFDQFKNNIAITEIWSNADTMSVFASFNPAKRFLNNPLKNVMLGRLLLGYEHNAFVSTYEEYTEDYEDGKAPYNKVVELFNQKVFDFTGNAATFSSKILALQSDYDALNKYVRDKGESNYSRYRRSNYKDHTGKLKDFFDFIASYKYSLG